jgi:mannose-6-phosphate isomerase-like protein (cupin superfamily)
MPYIAAANAPVFKIPGVTFTGLASPSRGSQENSVWRVTLDAGAPGAAHRLTREEVFVVKAGSAIASLSGDEIKLNVGDSLVVPAFTDFSLANPSDEIFEAVVVLPVGGRGIMDGMEPFVPPWSV